MRRHFTTSPWAFAVAVTVSWLADALVGSGALAQSAEYASRIRVAADTQLDWAFPLLQRSPADPPPSLLDGYNSTAQFYEFFGPPDDADATHPLVIFVSPQDRPLFWHFWEPTCRSRGVLFACPRDIGNGKPVAHRVRAVLDVLDDVRQRFRIDPDRTYLVGFSGGAHVACVTAFHLPEYFGGVVCIGHAPAPPPQPWLVERIARRLSLAIVCGDHEPAGPLVEDLYGPWWTGAGVRVEPVILRRHGHTMPDAEVMDSAYAWLEAGLAERRAASQQRPALRIADAPSRAEWADRQLADAKSLLADATDAASITAGLQQLAGLTQRWPDVPAAALAQQLIADYAARPDRPWEAAAQSRSIELLALQAEGHAALAHDGRKAVGDRRGQHAKTAVALWRQIRQQCRDAELVAEADEQIAALENIAAKAPADAALVPLDRVRFEVIGDVTLVQGIEYIRGAFARLGYQLELDEAAATAAGVDLQQQYHPRLKAATFDEVNRRFLRRAGLTMQRKAGETVIRVVPIAAAKSE